MKTEQVIVTSEALLNDRRSEVAENRQRLPGWRGTVALGVIATVVIFLVNLGILVWTASRFALNNGIGIAFEGSCSMAKNVSTWAHLGINVLSSLLLAACNTGMQCLAAPTREEIDQAHAQRSWLDVGVNTIRNVFAIQPWRSFAWLILGLSSIPLHLVSDSIEPSFPKFADKVERYNSVVFDITVGNDFALVLVGHDFVTGGYWNHTRTTIMDDSYDWVSIISNIQDNTASYVRLENAECIKNYGTGTQSSYGNVLAVSKTTTTENVLDLAVMNMKHGLGNNWVCGAVGRGSVFCDLSALIHNADSWRLPGTAAGPKPIMCDTYNNIYCDEVLPDTMFPVDYCLAQPTTESCKVGISVVFLGIVLVCNSLKVMCLAWTAFRLRQRPLVTIGDAIASFIDSPDATTTGTGPISAKDVDEWRNERRLDPRDNSRAPRRPWKPRRSIGFNAASGTRWVMCSFLFVVFWACALGILFEALETLREDQAPTTLSQLRSFGIGKPIVNQVLNITPTKDSAVASDLTSLPQDVIVANLPQLLISVLYLLYNDLFTRMHLSKEWTAYSRNRKSLRVTKPEGDQRSTRFLQLPFTYSIPLLVAMIILHWLVSQTLFVSLIDSYNYCTVGAPIHQGYLTNGVGWSPYGLVLSLIVGGLMLVALWLSGLLIRYPKGMPLARTCSAAISAACHREEWDADAARKPLMWGAVSQGTETAPGHACFSTREVEPLVPGIIYA